MDKLDRHQKSDKLKWVLTAIVLVIILVVLGGIVGVLATKTDLLDPSVGIESGDQSGDQSGEESPVTETVEQGIFVVNVAEAAI